MTNLHQVEDAPLHHVAMPDNMTSSPLVACLDPRVDEQMVQEQMTGPVSAGPGPESEPETVTETESDQPPEDPDTGQDPNFSEARP